MKTNLFVALRIAALLVPCIAYASTEHRDVSLAEADKLVWEAVPAKTRSLPGFSVEHANRPKDHYYILTTLWSAPPNASAVIENYAVDSNTGDVFGTAMECDEKSNPALRKFQAKIRRKIGLLDSEYKKIKRKGPLCE
jgi:hypothetical protein